MQLRELLPVGQDITDERVVLLALTRVSTGLADDLIGNTFFRSAATVWTKSPWRLTLYGLMVVRWFDTGGVARVHERVRFGAGTR